MERVGGERRQLSRVSGGSAKSLGEQRKDDSPMAATEEGTKRRKTAAITTNHKVVKVQNREDQAVWFAFALLHSKLLNTIFSCFELEN